MGTRGPVPKRDAQRRRRNKPEVEATTAEGAPPSSAPAADEGWHPIARRWYDSLAGSGQSKFYEPCDWESAYLLAESMSRELNPQPMTVGHGDAARIEMVALPPKAASLAAWRAMMAALLVNEGDRRRVRLELERPAPGAGAGGAGGGGGGPVLWLDAARRSSG